jgi:RNA polymerase sigma factor (sigma-70 family)
VTVEDDLELTRRCAAGDADAWATFMRRYRPFMVDFGGRIVDRTRAADVADAVIADLWQRGKIATFAGRSSLRTWLGALVANAALNVRRVAASGASIAAADEGREDHDPAAREASVIVSRVLGESIAALPDEDRLLILMHYEQDLSLAQCAAVLGSSKPTLSRRLTAIRERLRVSADRITRDRYREAMGTLRMGLDPSTFELDLRAACAGPGNAGVPRVSKE